MSLSWILEKIRFFFFFPCGTQGIEGMKMKERVYKIEGKNINQGLRERNGWASQVAPVVKNPPANVGDIRNEGSIPGLERSPGGGHGTHSSILAWRIPWTEEPGGLWSIRLQWVRYDWSYLACMHTSSSTWLHYRFRGEWVDDQIGEPDREFREFRESHRPITLGLILQSNNIGSHRSL